MVVIIEMDVYNISGDNLLDPGAASYPTVVARGEGKSGSWIN